MVSARTKNEPPETCPVCGEEVPRKALACPECGADYQSGWREEACDGVDFPDDEFDYEKFVQAEFGSGGRASRGWSGWIIAAVAVILLLALALALLPHS